MSQPNPLNIMRFITSRQGEIPPDKRESIPLTEAADHLIAQGIQAARAGRKAEALSLFDQALSIDEDHVEALLWRGGLSAANEALPYLERAVHLDPTNTRAREGLEWARQRVGLSAPAMDVGPALTVGEATESPQARRDTARGVLPTHDIVNWLTDVLAALAERPIYALAMSILLLGLLGTAAVARAGMSTSDSVAKPTPPVVTIVGTASLAPNPGNVSNAAATQPGSVPAASASQPSTSTVVLTMATLDQAWAAQDWPQVITLVEGMLKRTPQDTELTRKLFAAHYNYGVQLVRSERLAEAVAEFDKALAIDAMNTDAQGERQFAQLYLEGSTALSKGDFAAAIKPLRTIYDGNPGYRSVKTRLYQAYIGYADALEKEGKKTDAYLYFQRAGRVDTQGAEAQAGMNRLKEAVSPQVASSANKKIEVDLAKQQVLVWENGKVIYRMKASTGKEPYVTRTGNFEILNHMPNAYSSSLGWGMPYWMGIYQAGGTENGFHGLARLGNGSVLSASVLGKPATSGCIMLGDYDAKVLYNWATDGTPVWIH